MKLEKSDKIIFFGDSITWAAKLKESGEGAPANNPFGSGFVSLFNAYMTIHYPTLNLRIINKGISGDRSIDLLNRIEEDVISYKPNWMVLMIGVNDAWRQFDSGQIDSFLISNDVYKHNVEKIISFCLKANINILICSPFMVETNKKDPLRVKLDEYTNILKELVSKYQLIYADIQGAYDKLLKKIPPYTMSNDRIHVNYTGHMIIMEEIVKAFK